MNAEDKPPDSSESPKKARARKNRTKELVPITDRKAAFQALNGMIMLWLMEYLQKNKRFPSNEEVAKEFKISTRWVQEHLRYLRQYAMYSDQLKTLTPIILQAFGMRLMRTGKAQDVMAWMKLVEGWMDPAALAMAARAPVANEEVPIGQLTAEDDELRNLETEYWETLRRRSAQSASNTASHRGLELQAHASPHLPEPHGEGGDSEEASSVDREHASSAREVSIHQSRTANVVPLGVSGQEGDPDIV